MTNVKFLYHKGNKEIFAYFPEEIFDSKGNATSYAHIGQHSACSNEYANESREAKLSEYKDLLNELVNVVGYNDLEILNKSKNIKGLPVTLEELYNGEKQLKIKLSDKLYTFDLVLIDLHKKIDCKISSFAANLWARTNKGINLEKYSSISILQREVKKLIKNKVDTNGEIYFSVSKNVNYI